MQDIKNIEIEEILDLDITDHQNPSMSNHQGRYVNGKQNLRRTIKRKKQRRIRRWTIIGAVIAVLLLVTFLLFKSWYGGDVLKGTWDMDGTTVYQFEGNGKGAMILPQNKYGFRYTINEEEKTVSIDFYDEKASDYTYSFERDRDKLILSGREGKESFTYEFSRIDDQ